MEVRQGYCTTGGDIVLLVTILMEVIGVDGGVDLFATNAVNLGAVFVTYTRGERQCVKTVRNGYGAQDWPTL